MAHADWFNENAGRSYPFLAGTVENPASAADSVQRAPRDLVLDAQLIFGVNVLFDPTQHAVWLDSIERDGDTLTLVLKTNAAAAGRDTLTFEVSASETIQVVRAELIFGRYDLECTEDLAWEAFLTFGSFTEESLDAWIGDTDVLTGVDEEMQLEPGCIRSLYQGYARSLNLVNAKRTRAENNEECPPVDWPAEQEAYVSRECIDGNVRFQEGYNCAIEMNADANTILISGRPGAGAGSTECEDVLIHDDEVPPAGRSTLDGGWRCGEVLRSINGVGGKSVPIVAGPGVSVTPNVDENRLIVAIDGSGLRVCTPVEDAAEDSVCSEAVATTTADGTTTAEGTSCNGRKLWRYDGSAHDWVEDTSDPVNYPGCSGDCVACDAPKPNYHSYDGALAETVCACSDACNPPGTVPPYWAWDSFTLSWSLLLGSGDCPFPCVPCSPAYSGVPEGGTIVQGTCCAGTQN